MLPSNESELIGTSAAIQRVREDIASAARCDAKVLISGESGAGKDVVARLIHAASTRRHFSMVTVNCAALTDSLLESELFGHVRGSFTGAVRDRSGALELAHRGTVFLDEVGETTARMQGMLLRFLETGEIQRVGSDRIDTRADVRVIAATNRDLVAAVAEKTFRADLFFRLNVFHMHMPALRERPEDIPALLMRFLTSFASQYQTASPTVSDEAMAVLTAYAWPGNVRELRNVAERLVVRQPHGRLEASDLPLELLKPRGSAASMRSAPALLPSRVDTLFDALLEGRQSFWSAIHAAFIAHDLTRDDLRALIERGLQRTNGSYRVLTSLFNMPPTDYKRFLSFLKKHQCHVAFQPFRSLAVQPQSAKCTPLAEAGRTDAWKRPA